LEESEKEIERQPRNSSDCLAEKLRSFNSIRSQTSFVKARHQLGRKERELGSVKRHARKQPVLSLVEYDPPKRPFGSLENSASPTLTSSF